MIDVAGLEPLAQDLVFARVVSKLREHLERRDLGVDHVVVFVDELNKYAPADGADTYVRKMLLDLVRARPLSRPGALLRAAVPLAGAAPRRRQRGHRALRPHGHRRARDAGLRARSRPATKIKLATLPKGELMVRHPHFTQPIFVRFPRPAVLGQPRGHRALSAGRRAALRRRRGAPAPRRSTAASRRRGASPDRRPARGRRPPCARRHPARAAGRRARLLHRLPGPPRQRRGRRPAPRMPAVRRGDDGYGF